MHEFHSIQLDDEDSSKYLINYLTDDSDSTDQDQENDHDEINETSSSLPNTLIITPVPENLFVDPTWKDEFEQLFRTYDPNIVVLYLKFFQRVRITFTSSENALKARLNLHDYLFHDTPLKTYFACPIEFRGGSTETFLRPPEPDKLFLISPPVSPPIGWEQKVEDPPVVDLNLVAAIAQLQPNQSHELLPSEMGSKAPAIIIHTCDDVEQMDPCNESIRAKLIRPTLIQTRRPPMH